MIFTTKNNPIMDYLLRFTLYDARASFKQKKLYGTTIETLTKKLETQI